MLRRHCPENNGPAAAGAPRGTFRCPTDPQVKPGEGPPPRALSKAQHEAPRGSHVLREKVIAGGDQAPGAT